MKLTTIQITDALDNIEDVLAGSSSSLFLQAISLVYQPNSATAYRVISPSTFIEWMQEHADWSFIKPYNYVTWQEGDTPTPLDWFVTCWLNWKDENWRELEIMMKAWLTEYDPLSNYNRTETWEDTRTHNNLKTEHTHGTITTQTGQVEYVTGQQTDSDVIGAHNRTYNDPTYTRITANDTQQGEKMANNPTTGGAMPASTTGDVVKTDTDVSTFESDLKDVQTVTQTGDTLTRYYEHYESTVTGVESIGQHTDTHDFGSRTDTTTHNGPDTTSQEPDSDTTTGGWTDSRTGTASGNIGVTTSQQMLADELALRMKSLADRLLTKFYRDKTFLFVEDIDSI